MTYLPHLNLLLYLVVQNNHNYQTFDLYALETTTDEINESFAPSSLGADKTDPQISQKNENAFKKPWKLHSIGLQSILQEFKNSSKNANKENF